MKYAKFVKKAFIKCFLQDYTFKLSFYLIKLLCVIHGSISLLFYFLCNSQRPRSPLLIRFLCMILNRRRLKLCFPLPHFPVESSLQQSNFPGTQILCTRLRVWGSCRRIGGSSLLSCYIKHKPDNWAVGPVPLIKPLNTNSLPEVEGKMNVGAVQ